jgi:hypothetical protein
MRSGCQEAQTRKSGAERIQGEVEVIDRDLARRDEYEERPRRTDAAAQAVTCAAPRQSSLVAIVCRNDRQSASWLTPGCLARSERDFRGRNHLDAARRS